MTWIVEWEIKISAYFRYLILDKECASSWPPVGIVNEESHVNMLVVCILPGFFSPFHITIFTRIFYNWCMYAVSNDKTLSSVSNYKLTVFYHCRLTRWILQPYPANYSFYGSSWMKQYYISKLSSIFFSFPFLLPLYLPFFHISGAGCWGDRNGSEVSEKFSWRIGIKFLG